MENIIVCGWPRSGNVWISRLLGDALNLPVVGINGGMDSLAAEGQERRGKGYVKQAHLWPGDSGHLRVNLETQAGNIFLLMVRDPRDIAVSAAHYWDWTLDETLSVMIDGPGPLELPPWSVFVERWLGQHVPILRYEDFHQDTRAELARILEYLKLESQESLAEVVERQSFDVKRAEIERRGNHYPFGRVAQLKHLRNGKVGEWRETLSGQQARRAFLAWRTVLPRLGYHSERLSC